MHFKRNASGAHRGSDGKETKADRENEFEEKSRDALTKTRREYLKGRSTDGEKVRVTD